MSARDAVEARMRSKVAVDEAAAAARAAGREAAAVIRDKDLGITVVTDLETEVESDDEAEPE